MAGDRRDGVALRRLQIGERQRQFASTRAHLDQVVGEPLALRGDLVEQRLRLLEQQRDSLLSQLDAREDRAPAPAAEEARLPRIVGSIPVYDTDTPADVHRRAAEVRAGKIPADRASKFKVDGNMYIRSESLKTRFRGAPMIPLNAIVDRADFSDEDRAEYITAGALIPVG